jgi:hypothetical protein
MTVVTLVNVALSIVTLAIKVGAFGDAVIRPAAGFKAVDKMPKAFWLVVLGLSAAAQVATALGAGDFSSSWNGLVGLIGIIVALIYLFAIRPQVIQYGGRRRRGGPRSSGDSW